MELWNKSTNTSRSYPWSSIPVQVAKEKYWVHDLSQIVFLINKISSRLLKYKTPFTLLFDSIPDYNALRIFGFLAYDTSSKKHRSKLDSISPKCIYLEKKHGVKGHILFEIHNKQLFFVS